MCLFPCSPMSPAVSAAALSLSCNKEILSPPPSPSRPRSSLARCSCPEGRKEGEPSVAALHECHFSEGRSSEWRREGESALTALFPLSHSHFCSPTLLSPLSFHAASVLSHSFFRASRPHAFGRENRGRANRAREAKVAKCPSALLCLAGPEEPS